MTLPTRKIGPFTVSAVSLGCMNLSQGYGVIPSDEEGAKLLNHALDAGITMLDTAALYGNGHNEQLIGKSVMHRRREFMLASKCVLDVYDGQRGLNGSPAAISKTLDEALARLGTDHIDLYYLHRLDFNVPIEESVGALVRAKEAGKIGAIGLSEMSAATLRRAHAVHPIAAMQSEYSPMVRNVEVAVLNACRELDVALVAFSPVSRGMLAGAVADAGYTPNDLRGNLPRFTGDNLVHNLALFDRFKALAAEAGATPAQLAIGWVLSRNEKVVALPGTRSAAHLNEDIAAATMTFGADILAAVEAIFTPGAVRGARYPANLQAQIDTELLPEEIEA